jgi:hypothetical protein
MEYLVSKVTRDFLDCLGYQDRPVFPVQKVARVLAGRVRRVTQDCRVQLDLRARLEPGHSMRRGLVRQECEATRAQRVSLVSKDLKDTLVTMAFRDNLVPLD